MPARISLSELRRRLDEVGHERELRPFVSVDDDASTAFGPRIRPHSDAVDDHEGGGDGFLELLNEVSKRTRQFRYRRILEEGWNGLRVVSEGDSWFQYPVLLDDVIDHLFDHYAIYCLGGAGHLLDDMVDSGEVQRAVREQRPDVVLLSGGGNDLVGDGRLAQMIDPDPSLQPRDAPNAAFEVFLERVSELYERLVLDLTSSAPNVKIFVHGYDRGIPNGGKWLGKPMESIGISNLLTQRAIFGTMIDRLNAALAALAQRFEGTLYHVDCRGAVLDHQWHDELHPSDEGYAAAAARFAAALEAATAS